MPLLREEKTEAGEGPLGLTKPSANERIDQTPMMSENMKMIWTASGLSPDPKMLSPAKAATPTEITSISIKLVVVTLPKVNVWTLFPPAQFTPSEQNWTCLPPT